LLKVLSGLGAHSGPVFVNRVLFKEDVKGCRHCQNAKRWQLATLRRLTTRGKPFFLVRNFPQEIAGASALQSFTRQLWQPK
jgi:hypothetical protein